MLQNSVEYVLGTQMIILEGHEDGCNFFRVTQTIWWVEVTNIEGQLFAESIHFLLLIPQKLFVHFPTFSVSIQVFLLVIVSFSNPNFNINLFGVLDWNFKLNCWPNVELNPVTLKN